MSPSDQPADRRGPMSTQVTEALALVAALDSVALPALESLSIYGILARAVFKVRATVVRKYCLSLGLSP